MKDGLTKIKTTKKKLKMHNANRNKLLQTKCTLQDPIVTLLNFNKIILIQIPRIEETVRNQGDNISVLDVRSESVDDEVY